jgi:type IV pilus assembly protein PilC
MIYVSNTDKLILFSNLSSLLSSGIPILEATDIISDDAPKSLQPILNQFKQSLTQGKTLASTLSLFPNSFDPITISLVETAEKSGNFESILKDIVADIKRDMELSEKVKSAAAYPLVTAFVFLVILVVILLYVIPKVAEVFGRIKVAIPLPTQILFAISANLLIYWPVFLSIAVLLLIGIILLLKYKKCFIISVLITLPIIKGIAKNMDLARFTKSLSLMLSAGIPITEALNLSAKLINNRNLRIAINNIAELVSKGQNLGDSLGNQRNQFPRVMINMIKAGEKSGSLEKSTYDLSEHFNMLVESSLKNLTTLMEPFLLLFMGTLVAGLMLSVIAPIYQLIGSIKPQ